MTCLARLWCVCVCVCVCVYVCVCVKDRVSVCIHNSTHITLSCGRAITARPSPGEGKSKTELDDEVGGVERRCIQSTEDMKCGRQRPSVVGLECLPLSPQRARALSLSPSRVHRFHANCLPKKHQNVNFLSGTCTRPLPLPPSCASASAAASERERESEREMKHLVPFQDLQGKCQNHQDALKGFHSL